MLGTVVDSADNSADAFQPLMYDEPATEVIRLGDTEVWRIYNFTEDAHPIHLHLVQFQVVQRNLIDAPDLDADDMPDYVTVGARLPVAPEDMGWQDTVWIGPGQSIDIIGGKRLLNSIQPNRSKSLQMPESNLGLPRAVRIDSQRTVIAQNPARALENF